MNHCETTRQRRSGACGCSASSLFYLGVLPTVELPETATRQRRAFLNFRQLLVSQRVQLQNHLRSVLVAQGLEAPRGFRAWTAAGLAFFDGLARAPHECAADELWRSELYVSLTLYRGVVVQLNGVEANDPQSVAAGSSSSGKSTPGTIGAAGNAGEGVPSGTPSILRDSSLITDLLS